MEVEVRQFGIRIRLIVEPGPTEEPSQLETPVDEPVAEAESKPDPEQLPGLERKLRNWRRAEAVRRGVPTYIIMTERTILAIVADPPADLETLRQQKGIGPKTMELYGEQLLELIQEARAGAGEEE